VSCEPSALNGRSSSSTAIATERMHREEVGGRYRGVVVRGPALMLLWVRDASRVVRLTSKSTRVLEGCLFSRQLQL
jgi:hypothetical protein